MYILRNVCTSVYTFYVCKVYKHNTDIKAHNYYYTLQLVVYFMSYVICMDDTGEYIRMHYVHMTYTYHHTYLLDNRPPVTSVVSPELHSELPRMCIAYTCYIICIYQGHREGGFQGFQVLDTCPLDNLSSFNL